MTRIAAIAALIALTAPAAASAGPVRIDLDGLRAGGTLYVQLQTRDQFLGPQRAAGLRIATPAAGALSVDLGEVAPGDYAITVWHDDNGNNRYDVDPATGAPLDGWAMVNGDALRVRTTFDQIKVAVPAAGLHVPLALHYGR
jgi:uncharacterized protein (DUF2141 family)